MDSPTPVVLDLDGVIVESNLIKHDAMLALFAKHKSEHTCISAYILANVGVRRDHKLRHILTNILSYHPSEALLEDYLARYDVALEDLLATAPIVPGVEAFLSAGAHPFYVSSSAPDVEVREQLARRSLAHYFAGVFGASMPKVSALRQVAQRHPAAVVVFFGDSVGDWEAANEAGVAFVAVVHERDNFPGRSIVKLRNFLSSAAVHASINYALVEHVSPAD